MIASFKFQSLLVIGTTVADPGFDLRGGVDFVNGGGGGRKSSESVVC